MKLKNWTKKYRIITNIDKNEECPISMEIINT